MDRENFGLFGKELGERHLYYNSPVINSNKPTSMNTAVFLKQKNSMRAATEINMSRAATPTKKVAALYESCMIELKSVNEPEHSYRSATLLG